MTHFDRVGKKMIYIGSVTKNLENLDALTPQTRSKYEDQSLESGKKALKSATFIHAEEAVQWRLEVVQTDYRLLL